MFVENLKIYFLFVAKIHICENSENVDFAES